MASTATVDYVLPPLVGVRAARRVPASNDSRPIFVDPSGGRARWCRGLLAVAALAALAFVGTVAVLTLTFVRAGVPDATAGGPVLSPPTTAVSTDVAHGPHDVGR